MDNNINHSLDQLQQQQQQQQQQRQSTNNSNTSPTKYSSTPGNTNNNAPKKRFRIRHALSCAVCRKRKLKCDRQRPCGTCVKKSIVHLCHYEDDLLNSRPVNHFLPVEFQQHQQAPDIHHPIDNQNGYMMQNNHIQHQNNGFPPPPHHHPNHQGPPPPMPYHDQFHNNYPPPPAHLPAPPMNHQPLPPPPPGPPGPPGQQTTLPPQVNHSPNRMMSSQMSIPTPPLMNRPSLNGSNHTSPEKQSSGSTAANMAHSSSISLPLPPPPPAPQPQPQPQPQTNGQNQLQQPTSSQNFEPTPLKSNSTGSSTFQSHSSYNSATGASPAGSLNQFSPSFQRLKSTGSGSGSGSEGTLSPTATTIVVNDLLNPSRLNNHGVVSSLSSGDSPGVSNMSSLGKQNQHHNPGASANSSAMTSPTTGGDADSFYSNSLVSIPLGTNSSLQINAQDTMDVFTDPIFSLHLTGNEWQQVGTLSYLGLTKSDPFITILRNFLVHLFKSDEITKVIQDDVSRKRRNSNGSLISYKSNRTSDDAMSPSNKRPKLEGSGSSNLTMTGISPLNFNSTPMNTSNSNDSNNLGTNLNISDTFGLLAETSNKSTPMNDGFSPMMDNRSEPLKKNSVQDLTSINSFYSGNGKNKQEYYRFVESQILKILPDKTNLFQLFCRYFKFVNPFNQIIDEHTLLLEINPILPKFLKFNHERFSEVRIKNDNELRTLGIFLVLLKLGYQTMIHNDNEYNNYDEKDLSIIEDMEKLDTESFTCVINLCVADGLTAAKSSFKLVQLLTMLYYYKGMSPDDSHGLCGADSQILLGIIIRHAFSIGLNRDPTKYTTFQNLTNNPVLIRTWRHLWWYLSISDAMSAFNTGCNLNIMNLDVCDVEYPQFNEDPSGEMNKIMETLIQISMIYRNIVNKINNLRQKPKVVDILKETNQLERIFFDFFGKDFFKDVICKPSSAPSNGFEQTSKEHLMSVIKVFKFCLFIQLRTNLSGMYYKIAIHYENEYDRSKTPSMKAGIELFKIYIKSVVQLVYIMSYVLDNSVELFGKNFDCMLTASNERYMIKTHSFLTSFFVRLLHQKKELSFKVFKEISYMSRLEDINSLFDIVLEDAEVFVGNFRKLSRTYINSYRLYIMTYIVLRQCVDNADAFFEKAVSDQLFFYQGTNMIEFFSPVELQRLCSLCKEFRNAKEQQRKLKNEKKKKQNGDSGELFDDPLKDLETKLFGNVNVSFFDDEDIFSNLNNLSDKILDPLACKDDLIRLYNIYGDFDNELLEK